MKNYSGMCSSFCCDKDIHKYEIKYEKSEQPSFEKFSLKKPVYTINYDNKVIKNSESMKNIRKEGYYIGRNNPEQTDRYAASLRSQKEVLQNDLAQIGKKIDSCTELYLYKVNELKKIKEGLDKEGYKFPNQRPSHGFR